MPTTSPFYSVNEVNKPAENRVYHDNTACGPGQEVPERDRRSGTNNYRRCYDCDRLDRQRS